MVVAIFLVYAQSKCKCSRQAMKGCGKEKREEDGDTRREEIQRCRWERKKAEGKSAVRRSLGRSLFRLQGIILDHFYTSSI